MQVPEPNIRSSSYLVAERQTHCAHCRRPCRVLALAVPRNHETLIEGEWQRGNVSAFIFHIAALPDEISRQLFECCAQFHQIGGDDPAGHNWANHCPHCAQVFSDDELHCEPGGFMPGDAIEASAISMTLVQQPFRAFAAGYAPDPDFFASIRMR